MLKSKSVISIFSPEAIYYNGEFYDHIMEGMVNKPTDIPFWIESVNMYGKPVLELTCGTGRIITEILDRSHQSTGIDNSESMLSVARNKSPYINWINADVRNFNLNRKFPLIIFPYNAFCHFLKSSDVTNCLSCIKDHLTTDGTLIIDIFNPSSQYLMELLSNRTRHLSTFRDHHKQQQVTMKMNRVYSESKQVINAKLIFEFSDSQSNSIEEFQYKVYFPQEIDNLVKQNSFSIQDKFGDFKWSPFNADSSRQILVCKL